MNSRTNYFNWAAISIFCLTLSPLGWAGAYRQSSPMSIAPADLREKVKVHTVSTFPEELWEEIKTQQDIEVYTVSLDDLYVKRGIDVFSMSGPAALLFLPRSERALLKPILGNLEKLANQRDEEAGQEQGEGEGEESNEGQGEEGSDEEQGEERGPDEEELEVTDAFDDFKGRGGMARAGEVFGERDLSDVHDENGEDDQTRWGERGEDSDRVDEFVDKYHGREGMARAKEIFGERNLSDAHDENAGDDQLRWGEVHVVILDMG